MGTACTHGEDLRGEPGAVARALSAAQALCDLRRERLTEPRRRVLELLLQSRGPVKAYDLMAGFGPDGAPAKPPTVYRALEFLERLGLAHRIESLNAYVACNHAPSGGGDRTHAAAFLICECCGAAQEVHAPPLGELKGLAASAGYAVHTLMVEAHGLCAVCRTESA